MRMSIGIKFLNSLMVLLLLAVGAFPAQASAGPLRGNHDNLSDAQQHEPSHTKVMAPTGDLAATPTSLRATVDMGSTETLTLTLENTGSGPLSWEIMEEDSMLDVPWLSENPISGTLAISGTQSVEVTFDAALVSQPGTYYTAMNISGDTPSDALTIPVSMTVPTPPNWGAVSGVVTGLGHCDAGSAVLNGAEVVIKGSGKTYTVTTDSGGRYLWWLPVTEGPLTVSAGAGSYQGDSVSAVAIAAGNITTQNFDLRLLSPCISAEPGQLTATLSLGHSETLPLMLLNSGPVNATFNITITEKSGVLIAGDDTSGNLMGTVLAELGYTSQYVSNEEFQSITVGQMLGYQAVFYAGTPPSETLSRLVAYLDAGGALYIASNDLGRELGNTDFYKTYLQATYQGLGGADLLAGENIMAELLSLELSSFDSGEGFIVGAEGTRIFKYKYTSSGYAGGVAVNRNGYKAIYTAFDFADLQSTIVGTGVDDIIRKIMKYLTSSWLSASPLTGTVAADNSQVIMVTFDAMTSTVGAYGAVLEITSNDPISPTIEIPVVMHIVPLEGYKVYLPLIERSSP